jgi:hypothetical protein
MLAIALRQKRKSAHPAVGFGQRMDRASELLSFSLPLGLEYQIAKGNPANFAEIIFALLPTT